MPSIFKNIRRKLVQQSKVKSYLIYATGEIVLVVIGILIALQVNEWRDQYRSRQKELITVHLLIDDLQADVNDLQVFQHMLKNQQNTTDSLLNYIPHIASKDTLAKLAKRAINIWNYRSTHPTYDGLKESGQLDIISNQAIRTKIISYFDESIPYLEDLRIEYRQENNRAQDALSKYFGNIKSADGDWVYTTSGNYRGLKGDQLTQNILGDAGRMDSWLDYRIETLFIPQNEKLQKVLTGYISKLKNQ